MAQMAISRHMAHWHRHRRMERSRTTIRHSRGENSWNPHLCHDIETWIAGQIADNVLKERTIGQSRAGADDGVLVAVDGAS
jgi:hypothetical protein